MDDFFSRFVLSNDRRDRLLRHVVFWTVCWTFLSLLYGFLYTKSSSLAGFQVSFVESLIYLPEHIFLAYGIIYFVLPRFIFRHRYWQGLLITLLLIICAALFSPLCEVMVLSPYRESIGVSVEHKTIFYSFLGGLRGSMTVAGFAVAIKLLKHWHSNKIENEQLEKEKIRAELELLKAQLHPHFMFNALNSIYSMALKKSPMTGDAILKLSQLMRYLVSECNQPVIALAKEIEVLTSYIEIEKNRFGNNLDLSIQIDGEYKDKWIAPLLLLPFVENSFKHGTGAMEAHAWMSLDLRVDGEELKFKMINGKPTEANRKHTLISGIGMLNIKKRLRLQYPQRHDLRITEDPDMFMVALSVKLNPLPSHYENALSSR